MHRIRKIIVLPSHLKKNVIGCEREYACYRSDHDSLQYSTLLKSPWKSDSSTANHGVPSVEDDHDRACLLLLRTFKLLDGNLSTILLALIF